LHYEKINNSITNRTWLAIASLCFGISVWFAAISATIFWLRICTSPSVNFIKVFFVRFLYERRFGSFFLVTFGLVQKFFTKKRVKNVDEIDTLCGFDFLLHKINCKSPTLTNLTSYRLKFRKKYFNCLKYFNSLIYQIYLGS